MREVRVEAKEIKKDVMVGIWEMECKMVKTKVVV